MTTHSEHALERIEAVLGEVRAVRKARGLDVEQPA